MLEHWYRLSTSYFNTKKPTVAASGNVNLALDGSAISWVRENLQPVSEGEASKVRRAIGFVDLYAFIDECEARAKIVNHGPYLLEDNEILIISEYTNLYDGGRPWLPWSATEAKLPTSTLGVAMAVKGARATFNDIGTVTVDSGDYTQLITKVFAYAMKALPLLKEKDPVLYYLPE